MTEDRPEFQLGDVAWPRRTERLLVRPTVPGDAEATWAYRHLPEVSRWITIAPSTYDDYARLYADPGRLAKTLVVELAGTGQVVGDLMLWVGDAWSQLEAKAGARQVQAEIGYALDPAHQGRGYARESVSDLLDLCFGELGLRWDPLESTCRHASLSIL